MSELLVTIQALTNQNVVDMGLLGYYLGSRLVTYYPGILLLPTKASQRNSLGPSPARSRLCWNGKLHSSSSHDPLWNCLCPTSANKLTYCHRPARSRIRGSHFLRVMGNLCEAQGTTSPNKTIYREPRTQTQCSFRLWICGYHVLLRE